VKVAALYDVHAMPVALGAVLAEVERERVDVVLFGGDLVVGPFPREVVATARALPNARFVRGNAERDPYPWDREHLDADALAWLAALPLTASLDGVLYCHAAPDDDEAYVTAITPPDALRDRYAGVEERTVVIGHTHTQFDLRAGDLRVVNAGSVGWPYEDEAAAYWALVDDGEPSFRRTPFDVERTAAEVGASGWPLAARFVESLGGTPTREEAIAHFEGLRRGA
jgi:diadenosine tetraphosphatase ApaH/serine/threonine PP2A family protein phosphatase